MEKYILHTDPLTGNLCVTSIVEGFEDRVLSVLGLQPEDCEFVNKEDIPSDRTHREAWVYAPSSSTNKVVINKSVAKGISLARLREKRNAALSLLDKEYMIAQREGTDTTVLDVKRTQLLNATEELKAIVVEKGETMTISDAVNLLVPYETLKEA